MRRFSKYVFLCFTAIFCMATWCDEYKEEGETSVIVENKSNEKIIINSDHFEEFVNFDASLAFFYDYRFKEISAQKKSSVSCYTGTLEMGYNFQIIVFKQSTLDKYTRKELADSNIYDKLYVLSYDDLKALNFHIIYTGD